MTAATLTPINAAVPLSILEAMQHLDAPVEDGLSEFHRELAVKRLGMSDTVAVQIERYRRLAERSRRVDLEEVSALFRLVGRRNDAGLVFADAGRRAGRRAIENVGGPVGVLGGVPGLRSRFSFMRVRRAAKLFDARLERDKGVVSASIAEPPSAAATPAGVGCGFYGSAFAEILRDATDFDGAMFHVECRSRGDATCRWRSSEK